MQGSDEDFAYQVYIKCVCLILGHPNRHRDPKSAKLHPDFWVHDLAGCPEQNDVQRWQGDPRSPWIAWMTENSLGGLPCVRLGMNQGILHHITSYYHVLPYFGGRLLAFVGLLSGERLPFSCVLGVKYAVVENLVQQFPSPSSVKMDHCNSAVKPVLIDVVKSLSIRWICMPCICSFWGHSQTWLREQKVQETPTSGP